MQADRIKLILNKVRLSFDSHAQHVKPRSTTKGISVDKSTPLKPLKAKIYKQTISSNKNPLSNFTTVNRNEKLKRTDQIKHNITSLAQVTNLTNVISSNLCKGMNDKFLFMRKQNHLNTYFNIRKKKLKDITKVNQQFYKRLNTQKSFYSNSDLTKSYQSTKSIQERLSQSKLSNRINLSKNSSRKSLKSQKSTGKVIKGKKRQQNLQIKANDINKINEKEVNSFKCLFIRDFNNKTQMRKPNHIESNQQMTKFSSRKYVPGHKKMKSMYRLVQKRKSIVRSEKVSGQGGLLHRIQEDLYQNKENIKQSSLYVSNRRQYKV